MTQANHLLGTIQPESPIDNLIENDGDGNFVAQDEEGAAQPKASKGKTTRRRTQTKKRHYTEDSIRLYLQEIGRIRLLRAEEEIELARKIADLLKLERILDDLEDGMDREATDQEWAAAVRQNEGEEFSDDAFMLRVRRGRRAKDKMVQSNLRSGGVYRQKVHEPRPLLSGLNSGGKPGANSSR
jgi:RNA polymerase primary sigma factor